jgi:peptidoglycan/xylan/chitin deacetylase (PgdA/CDA1 family)
VKPIQSPVLDLAEAHSDARRRRLYFLYHHISGSECAHAYTLTVEQFRAHLSVFVETRGVDCSLWPEVTFDDGHISNLDLALPLLQAHDLTAKFFVTVGWTGRRAGYLGWQDLRALRDAGHQIGAHGWSHRFLTQCGDEDLKRELLTSRLVLEDKLGIEVTSMACPGGRYDRRVISACRTAGYQRVYTSVPEMERFPQSFLVGRVNVHSGMGTEQIRQLASPSGKVLSRLRRRYLAKRIAKTLLSDRIYDTLWWMFAGNGGGTKGDPERDDDSARYQ